MDRSALRLGAVDELLESIDREAALEREQLPARVRRFRALSALVLAATVLTALEYASDRHTFERLIRAHDQLAWFRDRSFRELWGFVWWSGAHVAGYFVVPVLWTRFGLGMPLRDHGLGMGATRSKLWVYLLLLALVLPVIIAASFLGDFAAYYPFYSHASRSGFDLLCWELLYFAQFFALEYFFRGFLLHTCRPAMGSAAIYCMIVPYCMIHFGKPALEAFAAIFAGLILGTLALATRSIWGGVLIHVGVALAMDLAALLRGPGLPVRWWPHL